MQEKKGIRIYMDKENFEIIWEQELLPEIEAKVSSIAYETFIKKLIPVDFKGNTIILRTQSKIVADTVQKKCLAQR